MTDALYWLTLTAALQLLLFIPYALERVGRIGLSGSLGYSKQGTAGFEQSSEAPAAWASRAFGAQRNALENLPIIATLVLIAHVAEADPAFVGQAAMIYFFSRIAHYVVYTIGVPVLRSIVFFGCYAPMVAIALALLGVI